VSIDDALEVDAARVYEFLQNWQNLGWVRWVDNHGIFGFIIDYPNATVSYPPMTRSTARGSGMFTDKRNCRGILSLVAVSIFDGIRKPQVLSHIGMLWIFMVRLVVCKCCQG